MAQLMVMSLFLMFMFCSFLFCLMVEGFVVFLKVFALLWKVSLVFFVFGWFVMLYLAT